MVKITQPNGIKKSRKSVPKKNAAPAVVIAKPERKKYKFRPGTVAKREIHKEQGAKRSVKTTIPKSAFTRLVREITAKVHDDLERETVQSCIDSGSAAEPAGSTSKASRRGFVPTLPTKKIWKKDAMRALHDAAEAHLYESFLRANHLAVYGNRETVTSNDLTMAAFVTAPFTMVPPDSNNVQNCIARKSRQ